MPGLYRSTLEIRIGLEVIYPLDFVSLELYSSQRYLIYEAPPPGSVFIFAKIHFRNSKS